MCDNQLAVMMVADDAYAGSESFYRLADSSANCSHWTIGAQNWLAMTETPGIAECACARYM